MGLAPPEEQGTCFGYAIRSPLRLRYARGGSGEPLDVTATSEDGPGDGTLVLDWRNVADAPYDAMLYEDGPGFRLWVGGEGGGWFVVDPSGRSVRVPETADSLRREERLWGIPSALCLLARGDHPLHAAAVEVDGRAILLAAPSSHGKTTLAVAFCQAGHSLLAEDLSCVRLGAEPSVVPGPAMLRVRQDVVSRLDLSFGTVVGESGDRVHLALDEGRRTDCAAVPLAAVVLLHDGDDLRLERMRPEETIPDLWTLSFRTPTKTDAARCFENVSELAERVPVWNLYRPLRLENLAATVDEIIERV